MPCVLIDKLSKHIRLKKSKSRRERERNSSRLQHANYINISIWCLIFHHSHSPHWPLLPLSLGSSGPIQDKVMLLPYVMNLPPDPKDACRDLAYQHAGRVAAVAIH